MARPVPGYLEELGPHASDTETFVALKAEVRTGAGPACRSTCAPASACRDARSEIVVQYRDVPYSIFREASRHLVANGSCCGCNPTKA